VAVAERESGNIYGCSDRSLHRHRRRQWHSKELKYWMDQLKLEAAMSKKDKIIIYEKPT
jgi:hypothetical protein